MRFAPLAALALALPGLALPALALPAAAGAEERAPRGAFVSLVSVEPSVAHDIRYFGEDNFVGRPVRGYAEAACLLTRPAASALRRAQSALRARGLALKVFDCYRPRRAVADFVRWADDLADQRTKRTFYPRVNKRHLFRDGYIARRSAHSRGSTVDLTVARTGTTAELDMGTRFDFFDPRSHTLSPQITGRPRANRLLLRRVMRQAGFAGYAKEWWHFTLRREPFPVRSFDFPVREAAVR